MAKQSAAKKLELNPTDVTVGRNVRKVRGDTPIGHLARALGFHEQYITDVEGGILRADPEFLRKLIVFRGLDLMSFFDGQAPPEGYFPKPDEKK